MTRAPSDLLTDHLPHIEQIARSLCRRRGLNAADAEDFHSYLLLRLLRDDCGLLRAYRGHSSLPTYLAAVAARTYTDYRNERFGKWHPSAAAKRLGPIAVELEERIYRHHEAVEDALAAVRVSNPDVTDEALHTIVSALPPRVRYRYVGLENAAHIALEPDVSGAEREDIAVHLSETIRAFIDRLPEDEQLLFKLRFVDELTMPEIARILRRKPDQLYQLVTRRLDALRRALEAAGIRARDAEDCIGKDAVVLRFLDAPNTADTEYTDQAPEKRLIAERTS